MKRFRLETKPFVDALPATIAIRAGNVLLMMIS